MENVTLTGIDLGKHAFHIPCQHKSGNALLRKKFTRTKLMQFLATCPSSVVVMEACAGAHFKKDFVDAEAICEAASRPSMRFVQPKTEVQQARY